MTSKEKLDAVTGAPEVPKHLAKDLDGEEPKKEVEQKPEAETAPADKETGTSLDDDKTEQAIDDIVRSESDELLAVQDKTTAEEQTKEPRRRWWKSGRFWKWTLLVLAVAIAATFAFQASRYWVLNHLGVRVSASVVVLDSTTGEPLKNVAVTIAGKTAKTDMEGKAKLDDLMLGKQALRLERAAFAQQEHRVVLGWGSNPLGVYKLKATGAQYVMQVVDYLSGKPIVGAEASNAEAAAVSNKEGQIVLTLEDTTAERVTVRVSAADFRTEEVELSLEAAEPTQVVLVPSNKAVFISKESGKYDLYSMDIDGKNKKVLLPATGRENGNIAVVPSPDGQQVALVSTRDDVRTSDGVLLSTLTIVDIATGNMVVTDRGEQLQIIDWVDTRVIYHMVVSGQAIDNPNRQRIVSYDYKANSRAQLANASQIRSAASARGSVYFTDGAGYFKINPDGSNKQSLLDKPVWASYRTDYDNLTLQTETGWYRLGLSSGAASEIPEPASYASRAYTTNGKGDQGAWTEKANLHLLTVDGGNDKVLHSQAGLTQPVRWLTNSDIIFRVASGQEIADFVVSSQGGAPHKITDVTASYGSNPAF